MRYEDIIFEKENEIAKITINRPKVYNAVRPQTFIEMVEAFEEIIVNGGIRVVVLTGAGKNFCSGGDLNWEKEFKECGRSPDQRKMILKTSMLGWMMRNCGVPIIAAVRGYCVGGGNELNMLCDLTIASETAKFGQAGPKVGSSPIWWATQMLPRVVGEKKAREICMLCRLYAAEEAERMGLVNKVVPDDQLEVEVERWCEEIMRMSPTAIRITKTSLNFESEMLEPSLTHGHLILSFMHGTEEFKEGVTAFLEKRKPNWKPFI